MWLEDMVADTWIHRLPLKPGEGFAVIDVVLDIILSSMCLMWGEALVSGFRFWPLACFCLLWTVCDFAYELLSVAIF